MLRKTEDIAHKVEGCQDLVQLSPPLPSVSAAMASSTGLTLPVALVATGAVVGTGATTAMTAPVATSATPRPSTSQPARHHVLRTRRVWRAYVHDHPRRARRPSLAALVARAPAAPPRSLRRRVHPPHRRRPAGRCSPPGGHQAATWRTAATRCRGSARGSTLTPSTRRSQPGPYGQPRVPVCAACVCAPTRLPVTLLPRTVAGRCRGRPGCARQLAAAGLSPGHAAPRARPGPWTGHGPAAGRALGAAWPGESPAAASCGESPAAASMARREPGSCERARTRWWCVSRCRQLRAWPCGTARCRAPPVCVSAKFKN